MNNPIDKYRIWDEESKEYVSERVFINHHGECCWIKNGCFYPHKTVKEHCTGLVDENGKRIYAGDIICYDDTPYNGYASKIIGVVVHRRGGFYIDRQSSIPFERGLSSISSYLRNDNFFEKKTKIIGNIHEVKE